jgi:hypothetical protein
MPPVKTLSTCVYFFHYEYYRQSFVQKKAFSDETLESEVIFPIASTKIECDYQRNSK